YGRALGVDSVTEQDAAPLMARHLADGIEGADLKRLQDFLFAHCVRRATEYGLPVKLHTGYFAGTGHMGLGRVRDNMTHVVPLLQRWPDTTFVLMHITYPYQHET